MLHDLCVCVCVFLTLAKYVINQPGLVSWVSILPTLQNQFEKPGSLFLFVRHFQLSQFRAGCPTALHIPQVGWMVLTPKKRVAENGFKASFPLSGWTAPPSVPRGNCSAMILERLVAPFLHQFPGVPTISLLFGYG